MYIDFSPLAVIALGMLTFGWLVIGAVQIIRATIRQRNTLAKWDFLNAAEEADERERRPQRRDERIREVNDQTQRRDAS